MIRTLMAVVGLTAIWLMTGCATSRSEIKLQSPVVVAPAASGSSAKRVIVIGTITDERTFEDAPSDPSTPSLGFGGADKASDDIKARAVGRKRNTYGMALGDVLLQPGQTVKGVIRENLVAAFEQAGYQVKDKGDAGPAALVVDVHIKKFWAWFDPGFWAITLNNDIATNLVISGIDMPVTVSTHVEEKHAAATEDSWIQIVDKGLSAYRDDVSHRIPGMVGSDDSAQTIATPAPTTVAEPVPTSVAATTAPAPDPVTETGPATAMPSPQPAAPSAPALPPAPITPDVAASVAMAQAAASQVGCGAVQSNGGSTFIAPCNGYSVLIDCYDGQCRPMHTVDVKKED